MSYITINNKSIYYEEYGVGKCPTLLYLHGGPGESCLTYTHQAAVLGEHFHVISFDQYGVFRSDAIPEEQSMGVRDHVKLIDEMRAALGIERLIPLGHSFGGMLACLYAYLYPDRVEAVIYDCPMWSVLRTSRSIATATLSYYQEQGMVEQMRICQEILSEGISAEEAFAKAISLEMTQELKAFCHVISDQEYMQYLNTYIVEPVVPEECWYRYQSFTKKLMVEADYYEDYLPCLAEIPKPSLLMVGEYDMTCGEDQQAYFAEHAPQGQVVVLEGSAHMTWMQVPERYLELIREFVAGIRA